MELCTTDNLAGITSSFSGVMCGLYHFQTLLAGLGAIGAALFAGWPVWKQLFLLNLQSQVMLREALFSRLQEAKARHEKVEADFVEKFRRLRLAIEPYDGVHEPLNSHAAFSHQQELEGKLNWFFSTKVGADSPALIAAKAKLQTELESLLHGLHDIHWPVHNDQSGEDYSFSDEEWKEILEKSKRMETDILNNVNDAWTAYNALRTIQSADIEAVEQKLLQLDSKLIGNK